MNVKAKLLDYGVKQSKTNNLMVVGLFGYPQEDGTNKVYTWYGSLKEGQAKNITMARLQKMGFPKDGSLLQLNKGISGGALNHLQEYELVIEKQKDPQGIERERVVNVRLPGDKMDGAMSDEDLEKALQSVTNSPSQGVI